MFKARLVIALFMLLLGFIGLIVTQVYREGAWNYWRCISVIYALLSLGLNWFLQKKGLKKHLITLWHEITHWLGLIGSISVTSYLVAIGMLGRFEASIVTLLLLALATYLAGVYIEPSYIFVGILLAGFALSMAVLDAYFYTVLLPLTLVVTAITIYVLHKNHRPSE